MKTRLQDPSLGMTGICTPKPEARIEGRYSAMEEVWEQYEPTRCTGFFHHSADSSHIPPASIVVALTYMDLHIVTLCWSIFFDLF